MDSTSSPADPDFPAAHSMDSIWFAVDASGEVAAFDTEEAGAKPSVLGFDSAHDALDALDAAGVQVAPPGAPPIPVETRFAPALDRERPHYLVDRARQFARRGVAFYGHEITDNWCAGPYVRLARPIVALQFDRLLPQFNDRLVLLPSVRFAERELYQPIDDEPDAYRWNSDRPYISVDRWSIVAPAEGSLEEFASADDGGFDAFFAERGRPILGRDPTLAVIEGFLEALDAHVFDSEAFVGWLQKYDRYIKQAVGDDAFEELRRAANHPNGSALREAARSLALSRWPTQSSRIYQL